jgi:tetraprenyl-beta-curcumene synthase
VVASARQIGAALSALGAYLALLPLVRRELRRWRRQAAAIGDPALREHALAALAEKSMNVEAVAVFATLAPLRTRSRALCGIVALQVAIDYLDTLEEASPADGAAPEDGGYLARLRSRWMEEVTALPVGPALLPPIRGAVERCEEGQRRTHAAEHGDRAALERWAEELPAPPGYRWWELTAGASSSVAAHALIAAAAAAGTTGSQAAAIDAAYNPSIGALTVLLDALVDRDRDTGAGNHNYTLYYDGAGEAAERFARIAADALLAVAALPHRSRHGAILAGVAGFYLSDPGAGAPFARPSATALQRSLGFSSRLIRTAMTVLRRLRQPPQLAPDANSRREPG